MVRNFENQVDICRTNTAPSTAFRSFGDIQCKIITESAIDDAAFAIGMWAEDVREINLYRRGDVTPFGQALSYCYIREVWSFLKEKARFEMRAAEVTAFNKAHRWRKRGVAMLPVKYGSGYNALMLEQAVAVLSIHSGDGSITINQGGVEMGQGLMTVARQVAAYILNVPLELIEIAPVRTSVIPNPTSSGASTGTAYAAEVVKRLAAEMRSRLMAFADGILAEEGPEKCRKVYGIDYWNEPEKGWQAERNNRLIWQNIIKQAYLRREPLSLSFSAQVQGGEIPAPALTLKPFEQQPTLPGYKAKQGSPMPFKNFVGFTYSAACVTVEIDILTGETKVLSADLAYDAGWSLNPAIDIGQVEGAFVQGLGYVLSEKLVFEPKGDAAGRLNTLNTWTYKLPAAQSIPLEFNTWLFPRDLVSIPVSPTDGVLSSKEVGEPPLVLAASVFLAVKATVRASRLERGLSGLFRLDAPATVQEVRRACDVQAEGLGILA
jgi:xanthine dehydrogenase/oxidase